MMNLFTMREYTLLNAAMLSAVLFGMVFASRASGSVAPRAEIKEVHLPGIHNLFAVASNVFSGSSPESEEGFAALSKLGIKTIISVDGTKPDVESARRHGMRYVHLPHGYDGISAKRQLQLVKAAEELPGPFLVHCHHGKHRGPAAAAVICMAQEGWTGAEAAAWLSAAGTATNYAGLYETVREFRKPTVEQLKAAASDFPETAKVSGLVEAMIELDRRWEHLKAVRAAGYEPPKEHPDIIPGNEAVILREIFREAQRLPELPHGSDFIGRLKSAEKEAAEVERLLHAFARDPKPDLRGALDKTFQAVGKSCSSCHKVFRDGASKGDD